MLPKVKILLPEWAEHVIFLADAAYASKENFRCLKKLRWFYVIACAKTWNLDDGTPLKHRLKRLQKNQFHGTWLPSCDGKRRRWFYVRQESLKLNHLGDVRTAVLIRKMLRINGQGSVVFSKMRRNDPSASARVLLTKASVVGDSRTNEDSTALSNLGFRDILTIYQRRWAIEVMFKELKSGLGLGQIQVTKDEGRVERAVALGMIAYLCLLRLNLKSNPDAKSWSVFQAKWNLLSQVFQERQLHFMKTEVANSDEYLVAA